MTLPQLFKQTKTGAIQSYEVSTSGDTITVTQGQVDGKKQSYTTICTPKNVGKSNETTPEQQAELEAKAKWQSKLDSGYTQDSSGIISIKLPMKVKVYQDQTKNVKFPCISTPKLNGVNAMYTKVGDTLRLTSRGGLDYPAIPHLEPQILEIMDSLDIDCIAGELYIHGMHLQDITSLVKKTKPKSSDLEFHVFDLPNLNSQYVIRNALIQEFDYSHVKSISSTVCNSHDEIDVAFNSAIESEFEGTVIYNLSGIYEYNVRSSNVFKYKKAQDAEFLVIGYTIDKNNHPILECKTNEGNIFKVKPKGTSAERTTILNNINSYLNQWYTIEFEVYSKDMIPLKPVGIGLRSCTSNGDPLE